MNPMHLPRILPVLAGLLLLAPAALRAQEDRNIQVVQRTAGDERRLALVIGNSDYPVGPLRNPVNDARAIASALRERGFLVTHGEMEYSFDDLVVLELERGS